jgi:monoamine oxidase
MEKGGADVEEASDRVHGDKQFRVLSGYGRVVEWLRDEFTQSGGEVHLETTVTELGRRLGRVDVTARGKGGESVTYTAPRVVVTLPLGLLQKRSGEGAVRFIPELPGEATNTDGRNGTVHGAVASGSRAAREVLDSRRR